MQRCLAISQFTGRGTQVLRGPVEKVDAGLRVELGSDDSYAA
jgi:hypothetical protein